ncbi:hypothetical protein IM725_03650 [Ramlibacter aquaticus]|uniref:Uncharacterized protein n=1 Tax=Ramlibacter aquaticus TaxID=2780094 RepID=A0ABR9SC72_9BURK|nr:hypothetical protein [Ramlibacter aquaticus]MBE7939667.1 hypothetical protein [Ramlibacter aquaticus]
MTSKKAPNTKTPSNASKPRSRSTKPAQLAPQPETVQRYSCTFICVMGFPEATKDALGPEILKKMTEELNKLDLHMTLQDEAWVINLSSQILATSF